MRQRSVVAESNLYESMSALQLQKQRPQVGRECIRILHETPPEGGGRAWELFAAHTLVLKMAGEGRPRAIGTRGSSSSCFFGPAIRSAASNLLSGGHALSAPPASPAPPIRSAVRAASATVVESSVLNSTPARSSIACATIATSFDSK